MKRNLITAAFLLLLSAGNIFGQRFAVTSGNWNGAIWATTSGGAAGSASTPTSADAVTINGGVTVTVNINNAACASLRLHHGSGTNMSTLTFSSGQQLTVSGTATIGNSTSNGPGTLNMTSGGTLICNALAVSGTGGNVFTSGTGTVTMAATNTLPNSTVFTTFNNLTLNGATTLGRAITISGTLTQNANMPLGSNALTINGTHDANSSVVSGTGAYTLGSGASFLTTIATGVNGNLTTSGTKTFNTNNNFTFDGTSAQVTGTNMPTSIRNLVISNAAGVTLSQATTIGSTGVFTITSGILTTTSTNLLSVNNNASTGIAGGGTSAFVSGPLRWTLATTGSSYVFPIGKGGNYYPFTLHSPTGTSPVVTIEAFNSNPAGTYTNPITGLSTTEYWNATFSGTYTGGTVSLSRTLALGQMNVIGRNTTAANGNYTSLNGTVSGNSIINSNNTGNSLGWFAMATTQPTTLTLSNPATPVTAATICAASIKVPIHAFNISANGNSGSGTLTNFLFTTTGTYTAGSISNFKIWYNSSNSLASATLLSTNSTPAAAGSQTFPAFSCSIPFNTTYYFWITMDVATSVTNSSTLTVSASVATNMTTTLTQAGSAAASGTQTFRTPTVPNAGTDQFICSSSTNLAGNTITLGTGTWSLVSGTATITTPTSPTSSVTAIGMGSNTLRWTATNSGCSLSDDVIITRAVTPATPGVISGQSIVLHNTSGLTYSIAGVLYATTYIWTAPTGWIITSGSGTTSITVTSGNIGQNGIITVQASNTCGTSSASSLAVTISTPHENCNACHNTTHNTFGNNLTAVVGNANLCMSCHNPSGSAQNNPFYNSMKAVPGSSGNSHNWDVPAVSSWYETTLPSNSEMLARISNGQIICSTCHNQHNPFSTGYLRIQNTNDSLCRQCHSTRFKQSYASNTVTNRGTHPVDITYNGSDPRFNSTTTLALSNGKVVCSTCHSPHYAASNDGNLLNISGINNLCQNCHISQSATVTLTHKGMNCNNCHSAHSSGSNNILLIRDTILTPNSGNKVVTFTSNSLASNFGTGSTPFQGVCEVCHTLTDHYSNTSGGTTDPRHNPAPQNCLNCHPHNKGFSPMTNCFDCHNAPTDKPGVGPPGGRRQIVDNLGNGTGTGGDFKRTSHHVTGSIPSVTDCIRCHYMGDHMDGTVKLLDPDQGYLNIIIYDPANKASIESFCLKCHDSNGANGSTTPFSDNVSVPVMDGTAWAASSHKSSKTCLDCHDTGHGSNKSNMLAPYNYSGTGTGTDLMNEEEGFCLTCHGASGPALQVHLAFSGTNTATDFYKHDPNATYRKHSKNESTGTAFGGANRHVECVDCHNPHYAQAGTASAPTLLPTLKGAKGVEPTYAGAGAPTGFTWISSVTAEYQVCLKCHSSFTTLPTYLPGGWNSSALIADGLKKLTSGGTNGQIADSRDMAREFNPNNQSFHPVMAAGTNSGIQSTSFQTGWSSTSRMYCSSCHNNSNSSVVGNGRGPHGSANLHLLDAGTGGNSNYKTVHNEVTAVTTAVCTKCHQAGSYYNGNTGSRFGFHYYHVNNKTRGECYLCHDTHGSEVLHLMNFNRNVNTTSCISAYGTNSQSSFVHAAGTSSNSCTVTCHGTSHGTGKAYTPAYN